jgi:REP element-mobilizing transposase RayT
MSRPLRIEFEGALYHITSRGNARQSIFLDDEDRYAFFDILSKTIERTSWICHAFCLMTNHYHLILETPLANLSNGMRELNGNYTQAFNRCHDRVGHLFEGRYKSILVERDPYLKEVIRYVVLNPVRAGLVEKAEDWLWSSFRATAGLARCPDWLETEWVLNCFDHDRGRAAQEYAKFVRDGMKTGFQLKDAVEQQIYLGPRDFISSLQAEIRAGDDLSEIPKDQKKLVREDLPFFAREYPERNEAMARAYLSGFFTLNEVAGHFGVHYTTVSRAVAQYRRESAAAERRKQRCCRSPIGNGEANGFVA